MDFIKRHGALLMFVAVLGFCGVWISVSFASSKDADTVKLFGASRQSIEAALKSPTVASEYAYSPQQAAKLNHANVLKRNATRAAVANEAIGMYVAYPQPSRPRVTIFVDEPAKEVFATMGTLSNFEATAATGRVYLKLDIPKSREQNMMELVRVEIFRGKTAESVDTVKPYASIELNVEDPSLVRRVETNAAKDIRDRGPKKDPPEFKLPETLRAYCDKNAEPFTQYAYRARLVGRFTSADGKLLIVSSQEMVTNADGTSQIKDVKAPLIHRAPKDAVRVMPSDPASQVKLYATELTPAVSVTTPSNFELRLSGIRGTIPDGPRAPNTINKNYSVSFEVRLWIAELQNWVTAQLPDVDEGQVLSGKASYQLKRSAQKKDYDFTNDLQYKLLEVNKNATSVVATLENQRTGKRENFVVSKFAPPSPIQNELDKVIDAQNREMMKKASGK
ncbi:MAG TPA: hypothetical protein VKX17_13120 [Planctomycetota bacterium]|nr:hypothetical protein [Planctomycetota bacterium]